LSAYLDGVEAIEPALAARDRALMRNIETTMGQYRAQLGRGAVPAEVSAQAAQITALFDRAEKVFQGEHTDPTTAFLGSFTILLREGLEALLIVIGMIAFLRKAERSEMLPYVHAGWLGALLAGGLTWGVATYLVGISGANREVTEGLSALFAAVVLLSVGIWMHQKSLAGRWQQYLHAKMSAALTRRSAVFLFLLAFVAVYREVFETILFLIAMWSDRNGGAILGGLVAGSVALGAVAYWMLRISQRLPIRQFFSISSILIAVLAVILVGKGIAALQEAGWVAQTLVAAPRIEWLGIYPSWQSLLAQLGVAVAAVIGFLVNSRSSRALVRAPTS
jgi:high-affinity iron transporter